MISPQAALVYTMVIAAEADHDIADSEIDLIGDLVDHLPIFQGTTREDITAMAARCSEALTEAAGFDQIFKEIRGALSPSLRETAYALACDVVAADKRFNQHEFRALDQIRRRLEVDPATAAAIERSAQARFQAA